MKIVDNSDIKQNLEKKKWKSLGTGSVQSLNQLIEEKQGGTVTTYTYDPRGNQTQVKENGTVTAQYIFDSTNRLTQAEANGKLAEYTYDGQGNRINVKVTEQDPTNPANSTIVADTDFLIDPMTIYNEIIAAIDNQEEKTSLHTYGKGRVSVETEGEISYYITNEQGSVTDILDANCNIQATLKYDEFGILENPEAVSTNGNIFAYTGHVYDESTGLYYAKARYYDAEVGRFTQEDAYHGDGLNLYIYVRNNPVRSVDPSGYISMMADGGGSSSVQIPVQMQYSDMGVYNTTGMGNSSITGSDLDLTPDATILSQDFTLGIDSNIAFVKEHDLGADWKARKDKGNTSTGTQDHMHVWNPSEGKWAQNKDGSIHDKNSNSPGEPPKWVQKKLKEKTGLGLGWK